MSSNYYNNGYYTNGSYYINNNSNANVVTANLSGTNLNLYAVNSGSATITVCSSSSVQRSHTTMAPATTMAQIAAACISR